MMAAPAKKSSTMKTLQQNPAPGGPAEAVQESTSSAAGEQKQMADARLVLMAILRTLKYLSGQGISITREPEDDDDYIDGDNFSPFLEFLATDTPELRAWLDRKDSEWVSPDILNEMTEMMADDVLRILLEEVRSAEHFSVIMEEVDEPDWRKVSVCIRFVTEKLETEERFVGFQRTSGITADTFFQLFKDVLTRFSLPIGKCRGQCYAYAGYLSDLSGIQTGLQARMQELEPRALYMHCAAQVLDLAVHDVTHSSLEYCGFMTVVRDMKAVITLTKDSPDRPAWFEEYQGDDVPSVRPLFYTHHTTMDTALLQSMSSNYSELMDYLEDLSGRAALKASGLLSQLEEFSTFFSLQLMLKTFSRMDTANAELQNHTLQFHKAGQMVDTLREDIMSLREGFQPFWESTTAAANDLNLESPVVPKSPRRLKDGAAPAHTVQTPEEMYRQQYVDVIDTASASLNCRLSASVFKHMQDVEDFVVGKGDCKRIVQFYGNDFDEVSLTLHRDMCMDMATQKGLRLSTFHDVVEFLKGDQGDYLRSTLPEITKLVKQVLTVPVTVTSSSSERSIFSLERLGEYLQSLSRMRRERPNHLALLNCHCDVTHKLDMDVIANKFINRTAARQNTFLIKNVNSIIHDADSSTGSRE